MTQENKKLLLQDLCARLPYGVICNTSKGNGHLCSINQTIFGIVYGINIKATERDYFNDREEIIKPYFFPLSSMTEEQKREYNRWKHEVPVCHYAYGDVVEEVELLDSPESFEYLIENHFDYYGLIEKGLAIEVTKENNPYNCNKV